MTNAEECDAARERLDHVAAKLVDAENRHAAAEAEGAKVAAELDAALDAGDAKAVARLQISKAINERALTTAAKEVEEGTSACYHARRAYFEARGRAFGLGAWQDRHAADLDKLRALRAKFEDAQREALSSLAADLDACNADFADLVQLARSIGAQPPEKLSRSAAINALDALRPNSAGLNSSARAEADPWPAFMAYVSRLPNFEDTAKIPKARQVVRYERTIRTLQAGDIGLSAAELASIKARIERLRVESDREELDARTAESLAREAMSPFHRAGFTEH